MAVTRKANAGERKMFSILLVEDEKLELETLRDYVDWKRYTRHAMGGRRLSVWRNMSRIS